MGNHSSVDAQIQNSTPYEILELLSDHRIQLTEKQIRKAVRKIIEKGSSCRIYDLVNLHFFQRIKLTDEEIKTVVGKIIEGGNAGWMYQLLWAHFSKRVQLTEKQIRKAVGRIIEKGGFPWIGQLLKVHFPKLNKIQINLITKETAPNKMMVILNDFHQELDLNRFQWIVRASQPLHLKSFWEKCSTQLPQEKLIIVEERLVEVERRRLIAILQVLSKKRVEWKLADIMLRVVNSMNSVAKYLQSSPWQEFRYLCFDQGKCIISDHVTK